MNNAKESILVACEIGITIATVYALFRTFVRPDSTRLMQARAAKEFENYCQGKAEFWAHAADRAARFYESTRSVNA